MIHAVRLLCRGDQPGAGLRRIAQSHGLGLCRARRVSAWLGLAVLVTVPLMISAEGTVGNEGMVLVMPLTGPAHRREQSSQRDSPAVPPPGST